MNSPYFRNVAMQLYKNTNLYQDMLIKLVN